MVRQLLAAGAAVNASNHSGNTPLHLAITRCKPTALEVTNALLAAGALVNARNANGQTPLWLAAANSCVQTAELLLKAGAATESAGIKADTSLHKAAEVGSGEMVQLLLAAGALALAVNQAGDTPLVQAARNTNMDMVRQLLATAAPNGAAQAAYLAQVEKATVCAAAACYTGNSIMALHLLVWRTLYQPDQLSAHTQGLVEALREPSSLLAAAAVAWSEEEYVQQQVAVAKQRWNMRHLHSRLRQLILSAAATCNRQQARLVTGTAAKGIAIQPVAEAEHQSALVTAVQLGWEASVRSLVSTHVFSQQQLAAALMLAAKQGSVQIAGAALNARSTDGSSVLHMAAESEHSAVVGWLLGMGVAAHARNYAHHTAVGLAAAAGHEAIVKQLVGWASLA